MFRATMGPSSGDKLCLCYAWYLLFCVEDCLICWAKWNWNFQFQFHCTLHTGQSSTQNNKYQTSHKHSCVSWWWAHIRPKHVEIEKYKYTKNKLCTKLVLLTRLYRDALSTKYKKGGYTSVLWVKVYHNYCTGTLLYPRTLSFEQHQTWSLKISNICVTLLLCLYAYLAVRLWNSQHSHEYLIFYDPYSVR